MGGAGAPPICFPRAIRECNEPKVKLELLSVREGHEALDKCEKLSKLTEAGLARAHEIVAEKYEKAKEKSTDD